MSGSWRELAGAGGSCGLRLPSTCSDFRRPSVVAPDSSSGRSHLCAITGDSRSGCPGAGGSCGLRLPSTCSDFRRPSVVRPAASSSLAAPLAEEAPVSRSSFPERAAAPVFAAIWSDDSGTDLEDELLYVSPLPTIISPLQDSDTALPVSPSRYPAPLVPALADPAPAS